MDGLLQCGSAYHHFTSIDDITRILTFFLKPGGSLLVADLLKAETSHNAFPDNVNHIVAHRGGFEEGDIRKAFEGAGLVSFGFEPVTTAKYGSQSVQLFLAKGIKPLVL